ncbi:Fosmidomycin resistance protein [Pigmentiphaga humi]|uniref:Fosmidomycin resistance protein n=1 Tax=Pigmentiphaga humi TaxID=2478468 RepID=A0A3P4AY21_9BURK|nr:MFS transporter [Pigmentiphaga humi]VCU68451.1 Fosmidomycin resistance protein [Pigmentiphaga humi]
MQSATPAASPAVPAERTGFKILGAISFSHFLNDMLQSLILAVYPLLKSEFSLSFAQIGLITLLYQLTASLLQPLIGLYTDRKPKPYSLPVGMLCSMSGILLLAFASNYATVLLAAALLGMGSSIFHPESSRVARLASGGRHGLAQSIFQVGGNAGSAMGPVLAAWFILPRGQDSIAWFALAALVAMVVLTQIGAWYKRQHLAGPRKARPAPAPNGLSRGQVTGAISVLLMLLFSKYFYMASFTSYYTFYLMHRFGVSVQSAQLHLFSFLAAVALGTILGGPIGDRIGRKKVIWGSILGVAPFALVLPHVGLAWTGVLSFVIGLILASAFSAILVFAQELMPGKVGTVSGLFFGFAFGMGGLGAAVLGKVADVTSIEFVYQLCAFLPLLGLLTVFLPDLRKARAGAAGAAAPA